MPLQQIIYIHNKYFLHYTMYNNNSPTIYATGFIHTFEKKCDEELTNFSNRYYLHIYIYLMIQKFSYILLL